MNYLSLWIGNFGVVPWFSFLFFLFLPIFLSLRALLVLVCCVFEAMLYPFAKLLYLETRFLTSSAPIVKAFLFTNLVLISYTKANTLKSDEFFISKGEQIEINIKDLGSFSIGNKEVITSKFYEAKAKLLVKGKSLGFSDLVIWKKNGSKRNVHFYVVSKREQLKTFQLANDFKSIGLQVKALAFELLVRGELKSLNALKMFNLYIARNKERVISMVSMSSTLKREVIKNIYLKLRGHSEGLTCISSNTSFECLYDKLEADFPTIKNLKKRYNVTFLSRASSFISDNFLIEMKIIKTDDSNLSSLGLGLNKFGSTLSDFLNNGASALVKENNMLLSLEQVRSMVVSSPSIVTTIGRASKVQLGAEIPITTKHQNGHSSTMFKFAGLQLQAKLELFHNKIRLGVTTELTYPSDKLVRGSKSESDFYPILGEYKKAFQISYTSSSHNIQGVPGLYKIPIIRHLFSLDNEQKSTQRLIGFIKVTRLK